MNARRTVLCVLLALATAPGLAPAQTGATPHRIGYIGYTASNSADDERVITAFVQRLRELGFVQGANLIIEWRYAEGRNERYTEIAAEMATLGAELVVATSGPAARAVLVASPHSVVVTTASLDPVHAGLVASLGRPGGRLTGIYNLSDELTPKRIELLKDTLPAARGFAYVGCSRCLIGSGSSAIEVDRVHAEQAAAAHSLGLKWLPLDVNSPADFDAAAALRRERPEALLIGPTPVNVALRERWLNLATELKLPLMAPYRGFGAMLSYGPDHADVYREAAQYVAKILRGTAPGELAMAQPSRVERVLNLKLARSLGSNIPQSMLLRADEVIQ